MFLLQQLNQIISHPLQAKRYGFEEIKVNWLKESSFCGAYSFTRNKTTSAAIRQTKQIVDIRAIHHSRIKLISDQTSNVSPPSWETIGAAGSKVQASTSWYN